MNSPVSCLPDPIQNMKKKNRMRRAKARKGKRAALERPPANNLQYISQSTPVAPGSYGAIQGQRKYFPMTSGIGKSLTVANYEQVGVTFTGTGGFTNGGSVINPGITTNFPWLSSIANNYQKFRWKFLRYIFVPQCPSSTPGSVYLEMHYDFLDNASTSLAQVTATESSVVGNAWFGGALGPELAFGKDVSARDAVCLTIDTTRLSQPWYNVRATNGATLNTVQLGGIVPVGLTLISAGTYDPSARPGTIYYGTNGITNGVVAGNLYCSYVCEFSDPILAVENV